MTNDPLFLTTAAQKLNQGAPRNQAIIPARLRHSGGDFGPPFFVLFWRSKKEQYNMYNNNDKQ
jgi:hypothetical protein